MVSVRIGPQRCLGTQILITPIIFKYNIATQKYLTRFLSEVINGRMVGEGMELWWSLNHIKNFLEWRVYVIPCGVVANNDGPLRRIIRNYNYP